MAVLVAGAPHNLVSPEYFQPKFSGRDWEGLPGKEMKPATKRMPVGLVSTHFAEQGDHAHESITAAYRASSWSPAA